MDELEGKKDCERDGTKKVHHERIDVLHCMQPTHLDGITAPGRIQRHPMLAVVFAV